MAMEVARQILIGIWQNAPVWVWPIFFVLVAIGVMSMRPRKTSVVPYIFYPLFGLTAIGGIQALAHAPLNWIVFGLAYALGLGLAFRWQDRLILAKERWRLSLKGERITLVILMVIFFSNFVNGVLEAVAPEAQATSLFTVVFAGLIGACSGSFTGRALRVLTLGARNSGVGG
ncbi:MAG: hypothetical protein AAGD04_11770 [Pseudomonadota bacterium]